MKVYDAIVVGSGAAGGWAAKELTERGLSVLLLEAGRSLDVEADFGPPPKAEKSKLQIMSRASAILKGQQVQARCMSFSPQTKHLFVNDRDNPYTTPAGRPFNWFRSRQVGGRLHLWGRNALRISDHELKAASFDGYGVDWPIGYEDLAPWYTKVETFLGVTGSAAGIPTIPDGTYSRPHPLTSVEKRILSDVADKWPDRPATTARIIEHNPQRIPLPVLAAQETGRLELRSNAVVSHVLIDPSSGRARGVAYVDAHTHAEREAHCKVLVLCASTIESLRILLNSRSRQHPEGLGNSSGNLGAYLCDHTMLFVAGPYAPIEEGMKADPYDFGAQTGLYVPSFRNRVGDPQQDFIRGFSLLGSVARLDPGWFFLATGEMLARRDNRVTLDPEKKDAYGIPVARINCVHGDNERAMIKDMKASLEDLAQAAGLSVDHLQKESPLNRAVYKLATSMVYTEDGAMIPGSAIHETGGAGMGDDPQRFVLNKHNQVWDAPNVFVTDSASFVSSPYQNPGLTIMALSARAAHYIADQSW